MMEHLSVLGRLLAGAFSGGQGTVELKRIAVGGKNFDYQIYLPSNAAATVNLPLMIFLHGIGQRGSGGFLPTQGAAGMFVRQQLAQIPAIVLLPQCRAGSFWSDPLMDEMGFP